MMLMDGLPKPERTWAFITIALALTMAVLDGSIVNVALPVIAKKLAVDPSAVIWVVNAYQLAVVAALLLLIPSDVGQGFRDELGHRFRFDVGHRSKMKSATL
jgi:MFS transporter, DHA2 family, multidrug resistance protein